MNKYLKRLGAITLGVALSIGLGVFSNAKIAKSAKADSTITFNTTNSQITATGTDKKLTQDGVTLTFSNITGVSASDVQNAKNATIISTAIPGPITSVKIYNCKTTSSKTDGGFTVYGGTSASAITTSIKVVSGLSNTASDQLITFAGEYTYFKVVNGSDRVLKHSKIEINYGTSSDPIESISISGSMSKTTYYVGESWSAAGLTVTAHRESGNTANVTDNVTWTFNPATPATTVTSVVATATLDSFSASSSAQSVTVLRPNPIQAIYTKAADAAVDVYGYYVGFLDGTGPVIMDGEYGVVIYNKTADVSGYTENTTILHVTGKVTIYKGLYEIGGTISMTDVTSSVTDANRPDAPVIYSSVGGETADYASRLTTVTGKVKSITVKHKNSDNSYTEIPAADYLWDGAGDDTKGDATIIMTVGSTDIQVFYKMAAQNATDGGKLVTALSSQEDITVKGFTGWYNTFQVQMNGLVEAVYGYTADEFAQDLLDQTDAVCVNYVDGVSNFNAFKTALQAIWSDLASADKYPSLPNEEKTKLAEADPEHGSTVVDQAIARYEYLTGKYGLSQFINGRTISAQPISPLEAMDNWFMPLMIIACGSCLAFVGLIIIRRKRLVK